jgi:hypothetical protein
MIIVIIRYVRKLRWTAKKAALSCTEMAECYRYSNAVFENCLHPCLSTSAVRDVQPTGSWTVLRRSDNSLQQSKLHAAVTLLGPAADWHFFIVCEISSSNQLASCSPTYHRHPFVILIKAPRMLPQNGCKVFWEESRCESKIWLQSRSACRDLVSTDWFVTK